ncbi:MAG: gamma-glutamyltransferase [Myxococcales bacterium]|nr:gamma-glutamyltransferase [Myxococcales bacterium]
MHSPRLLLSALATLLACATPSQTSAPATPPPPPTPAPPAPPTPAPSPPPAAATDEPSRRTPVQIADTPGVAVGTRGAVASAEVHASDVGLSVLQQGGNAVDAAIAVGFALAVTHPTAGNIGGGGFMVVRMADGRTAAIDYRETAPAAATPDMYLDKAGNVTRDSLIGARAAGIPGTVAGLALAHERFGKLPFEQLVLPAVALARDGHHIDKFHARGLERGVKRMRDQGFEASARYFSTDAGAPLPEGTLFKQPELAATLERIAKGGPDAFYRGELAALMVKEVQKMGGIWTLEDLAHYQAKEREPLAFDYLGHRIIAMPPPSAGGVVLRQMMVASEQHNMRQYPWRSAQSQHFYVEAARRAYADRNFLLGDPDFTDVPTARLTDAEYIRARMADIDAGRATPSDEVRPGKLPPESMDTTHYSVVDGEGNAVSNTYTLNTSFGSKVMVAGTGMLLNNEMDDFAAKPGEPNVYGLIQGANNRIAPGKRMLSSMTPTIVEKDGELRAIVGTPGGPTITTTVFQILRALIDYSAPMDAAVRAPRLHHQWKPDVVIFEATMEPAIVEGLRTLGHTVMPSRWGLIGHANCIEVDPETRGFRAVADAERKGGAARAY